MVGHEAGSFARIRGSEDHHLPAVRLDLLDFGLQLLASELLEGLLELLLLVVGVLFGLLGEVLGFDVLLDVLPFLERPRLDLADLEEKLKESQSSRFRLIATDGVTHSDTEPNNHDNRG